MGSIDNLNRELALKERELRKKYGLPQVERKELKDMPIDPIEEKVKVDSPKLSLSDTVETLAKARVDLVKAEERLEEITSNFRAATELSLGLPTLRQQVEAEEPRLRELLGKLKDMKQKVGAWIVRLAEPRVAASPQYKQVVEELTKKLAKISPDLEKIAKEVVKKHQKAADKRAEEKKKNLIVDVQKEEESSVYRSASLLDSFIEWVTDLFSPKIDQLESQFDEIDYLVDQLD
jgi:hypothetical protein